MQKKRLFFRVINGLLLLAAFVCASSSIAHQQKEAYITLLFNKNTSKLEVAHRFLLHDAEHIFTKRYGLEKLDTAGGLQTDKRSQAAFAAYVEARFELASSNKKSLPLSSVGHEVQGKYLWVYQETPIPKNDEIYIKHSALQELWDEQVNHINIERDGQVRSIRLQKSDANHWRLIKLD